MSKLAIVVCAAVTVVQLRAHQVGSPGPAPQASGVIAGQVVNATDHTPVENAIVVLRDEKSVAFDSLRTNADGSFTFRLVPAGDWTINSTKSGYVPTTTTRPLRVTLGGGQQISGLRVSLKRYGAIGGRVVDETGEPAVGVVMRLFTKSLDAWSVSLLTTTDDRGMYRFSVGDGEFVAGVMAQGKPGAADQIYPAVFYPGSRSIDASTSVPVGVGEQREGVDFQLSPVGAVPVSGKVMSAEGPAPKTAITLATADADRFSVQPVAASATTDDFGRFTFSRVPGGRYIIRVRQAMNAAPRPTGAALVNTGSETVRVSTSETATADALPSDRMLWAEMPLSVDTDPITDVVVTLNEGHRVRGRVEFAGATPPPDRDQLPRIGINIWRSNAKSQNYTGAKIDRSGYFATNALIDARYTLNIVPAAPWIVRSIRVEGQEALDSDFAVDGRDVSDVVVTLSDRGSSVSGVVMAADGRPDGDSKVVIFPVDARLRNTTTSRRIKTVNTNTNGAFRISSLIPGEYWVAAVSLDLPVDPRGAEAMNTLSAAATRVTLGEADAKQIDLRTIKTIPRGDELGDSCSTSIEVGSISGVVVSDDDHHALLRDAAIVLHGVDSDITREAITDARGIFNFPDVPPGRFRLSASKKTFLTAEYGARRPGRSGTPIPVGVGQHVDVTMMLARGSVIAGTITGEHGDPIRWAEVHILTARNDNGRTTLALVPAETALAPTETPFDAFTDESGRYRFYGLPPGAYLVGVTAGPGGASVPARAQRDAGSSVEPPLTVYAQTFFPSVTDASLATTVELRASEQRTDIDIRMPLLPVAKIGGVVERPDGSKVANARVSIFPSRPYIPDAGAIVGTAGNARSLGGFTGVTTAADGRFQVDAMVSGDYAIYAIGSPAGSTTRTLWATAHTTLDGHDRTNLVLTLQPALTVQGTLAAASNETLPSGISRARVTLTSVSADAVAVSIPDIPVDATGGFVARNVMPGDYQLSVTGLPGGWRATAAKAQTVDALDFAIKVDPATTLDDIVVAISKRPAEVGGIFSDSDDRPVTDYTVIVFPTDSEYWTPLSRRVRALRVDADGHFLFQALPAGEYLMAAVWDLEPEEWRDRRFLQSIRPLAIKVTVVDGKRTIQNLRVAKVP